MILLPPGNFPPTHLLIFRGVGIFRSVPDDGFHRPGRLRLKKFKSSSAQLLGGYCCAGGPLGKMPGPFPGFPLKGVTETFSEICFALLKTNISIYPTIGGWVR